MPSLINITLLQYDATIGSWVTINIVELKFLFKSIIVFKNNLADFESNASVGSSAKIRVGEVESALAVATSCFCPLESSSGYLLSI
nr:hypothetical protein [Clostridium sp. ZBS13]